MTGHLISCETVTPTPVVKLPHSSEAASPVVRLFNSFEATSSDVRPPHQLLLGNFTKCVAARLPYPGSNPDSSCSSDGSGGVPPVPPRFFVSECN